MTKHYWMVEPVLPPQPHFRVEASYVYAIRRTKHGTEHVRLFQNLSRWTRTTTHPEMTMKWEPTERQVVFIAFPLSLALGAFGTWAWGKILGWW